MAEDEHENGAGLHDSLGQERPQSERDPEAFMAFLASEVWPHIPPGVLGQRMTREEEDEILGFGPDGV